MATECENCGGQNTGYQMFSGGREYYCRDCDDIFPYPEGETPRRLQMLRDGRVDELRAEMREHLSLSEIPSPGAAPTEGGEQ